MIEARLVFDTGTFVLIWMVQLIVYPSFLYYSKDHFLKWHKQYMNSLTYIVAPLLLGQVVAASYHVFLDPSGYTISVLFVIASVVLYTFGHFVALHNTLQFQYSITTIQKLIKNNWYRTFLWTLVLLLDLVFIAVGAY